MSAFAEVDLTIAAIVAETEQGRINGNQAFDLLEKEWSLPTTHSPERYLGKFQMRVMERAATLDAEGRFGVSKRLQALLAVVTERSIDRLANIKRAQMAERRTSGINPQP